MEKIKITIEVEAELKSFKNDKGDNITYVALCARVEGIPVYLQCKDITGKSVLRNYLERGGN